jgi:hypothetical protein
MSLPDNFDFHFYPVGQGLFSTGSIYCDEEEVPRFLWVYDCGTTSSQRLVDSGIERLKDYAGARPFIDLLTLSHFDQDHISGVARLLEEFKIGTLMLPYMPLAQRLVLAFEVGSGGAEDPMTAFYLNPVAFLLAQDGPGIERILFVLPSGNEGPAYPGELPNPHELGSDDELRIPSFPIKLANRDDTDSLVQAGRQNKSGASVNFLGPGAQIILATALWEFIPYNDDSEDEIPAEFYLCVAKERDRLLAAASKVSRKNALKRLKKAYDDHFGSNPVERNVISLFLYAGPIYPRLKTCWLAEGKSSWMDAHRWRKCSFPAVRLWDLQDISEDPPRPQCSILYSGDGYLDTNLRLKNLVDYLGEARVQGTGVFQVMHHGAEANWHQGCAEAIAPRFSVFSSDPERKRWKHPHAPVLRDFWRYGAVQVDKDSGFTASGYFSRL